MLRLLAILLGSSFIVPASLVAALSEAERPVETAPYTADEKPRRADLPSLFIVGDSTVAVMTPGAAIGWGQRLAPLFDAEKINVVNRAIGGRSTRTFLNEGRWQRVLDDLRAGDFVLIQFGHNDAGRVGDPAGKGRPTLPGTGEETFEDVKPDGSRETVHTFGWYLKRYAREAKARGVTLIVCSPIPHKQSWENQTDWNDHARWAGEVARAEGATFLDLTLVITQSYRRLGRPEVEKLFVGGGHTNDAGARFNARCVVAGVKSLPGNPLGGFFSESGAAIPAELLALTRD